MFLERVGFIEVHSSKPLG